MLPDDTFADAEKATLDPLTLAFAAGAVMVTVGVGGFEGPFFHFWLFVTGDLQAVIVSCVPLVVAGAVKHLLPAPMLTMFPLLF